MNRTGDPARRPTSLAIVMPCFNECKTLEAVVARVLQADTGGLERRVILVDDGSTDGTREIALELAESHPEIEAIVHERNQGKGAALRTGFGAARADIVLIQDADFEYDPNEYDRLLGPILDGRADVVFGSRFRGGDAGRVLYFWHSVGNRFLTLLANMVSDLNLTDMETCYKVFRREVLEKVDVEEPRFGFEPEITIKVARQKPRPRIYEVGISYSGRTYEEGKKIGVKDGFRAIYCIFKYGLLRPLLGAGR